ncbi:Membrane protein involved in the export of O-antigen and teichoic acid [Pseudomonas grimontii]|uniref:Membrane protein involved in the export of O-antigen and teichoic acid n=1 Tax=Pseudomonas grimontii TaxID=129847 RepID=A0ABY0TND4_9PSED|nr:oligosaccharide flippase family protein [Pseudomonas grimontii]SDR14399.1 Membrane protein involved in the export of O-antigen and teichoic acid [Pseudomonas grimontii]
MKAIQLLISSFGAAGATFLLQVILSRALDAASFGLVSFSNAITITLAALAFSGVNSLLLRRVSRAPDEYAQYMQVAYVCLLINTLVAFAVSFTLLYSAGMHVFAAAALATGVAALSAQSIVITQGQLRSSPLRMSLGQVAVPLSRIICVAAIFHSVTPSLMSAAAALGVANIFCAVLCLMLITRHGKSSALKVRDFLSGSIKYSLNGALNIAQLQIPISLLGAIYGSTYSGYLAICNTLLTALYIAPNTVFNTYFIKSYHALSGAERSIPFKHALYSFGVGVMVAICLSIYSEELVHLVFGVEYAFAAQVLQIAALSIAFRFFATPLGAALLSEEWVSKKVIVSSVGVALQVSLFVLLMPFDAYGIGASIVISELFIAVSYYIIYRKSLNA